MKKALTLWDENIKNSIFVPSRGRKTSAYCKSSLGLSISKRRLIQSQSQIPRRTLSVKVYKNTRRGGQIPPSPLGRPKEIRRESGQAGNAGRLQEMNDPTVRQELMSLEDIVKTVLMVFVTFGLATLFNINGLILILTVFIIMILFSFIRKMHF
jgi:hypothetical protein